MDVFVNATELVQLVVRLAVALEERRTLADGVDDAVTTHARVADHADGDQFTAGLLQ